MRQGWLSVVLARGLRHVSKRVERALLVWSTTGGELGWRMETC